MRILEELWYGNINDSRFLKNNAKLTEMLNLLSRNADNLMENLSEKEKEIFEKYKDCSAEISQIKECENFIKGFRLGALIMLEVMEDLDCPLSKDLN
ncbi:MAG: hypothetical protein HDT46_10265 [Ruminococcaceae bacterium]|nr:hypothetical protein [Oscillospiraceae bacterium]